MKKITLSWAEKFRELAKKWYEAPGYYSSEIVAEYLEYCDQEEERVRIVKEKDLEDSKHHIP